MHDARATLAATLALTSHRKNQFNYAALVKFPLLSLEVYHSLTHSLSHSLPHSLTKSLTHAFSHSLTHPLAHSFTYSLTGTTKAGARSRCPRSPHWCTLQRSLPGMFLGSPIFLNIATCSHITHTHTHAHTNSLLILLSRFRPLCSTTLHLMRDMQPLSIPTPLNTLYQACSPLIKCRRNKNHLS